MVDAPQVKSEPISASADERRNAYYVACKVVEGNKAFATCIHIMGHRGAEYIKRMYPDCVKAIASGNCRAEALRDEEIGKGHAIYFVERPRFGREVDDAGKSMKELKSYYEPAPKKSTLPDLDKVGSGDYADAINREIGKSKVIAGSSPYADIPTPKYDFEIIRLPGETPLQMARRLLASQTQETV